MIFLLLTAIIAAVASSPLSESQKWPWQVGKEYVYDVESYTWTKFEESTSNGNAFKTQFIIRVKAPGHLLAKLENPLHAQLQGHMEINAVPSDLKYQPLQKFDQSFEIFVDGGRVLSLNVPSSLSVNNENLLKGLISAIQVDLSTFGHVHNFPNSYDKETFQGLFKKMEADVTGDCETLYSVSPVSAEWRRELPEFAEDPIEITKTKNYGSCLKSVDYDLGVPEGAVWKGIAYENDQKQFIKHTSDSRMLVGKQGTIYKTQTLSSVFVNPLLFGKQKAEVYSYVGFSLSSVQSETSTEWQKAEEVRAIDSLLFTLSEKTFTQVDTQSIVNAQKLLQDITPLLQTPNNLPEADFLSKYNVLVRIIMSMDSEQLSQMTSSMEVANSSKNVAKNNMWVIYRDAVAQAGTIAAFKEIKAWILTKKIQGEEAAEVISSLSSYLHYPTKKNMNEFFDLALSPEVVEQEFLNNSALLAATKFIRSGKENFFVVDKVIPRLSQELKKAIEEGDNSKAQVYVTVLGNLAHPEILQVFAPYFEGRILVTKYLRIQMVLSLKTLANMKNENVRAVLFSILRNTAEPYEVRVAAALNIFMAYPSAEMMQVMAHMTHDDPSTQVRAVLVNSITFAAGLKDPRFAELAKNAQAVMSYMAKENFGFRYSADSIIDEYTSNDDITYFRELSFIGSENNILPMYQRGALRLRGNGLSEEDWFTLSVSDVQLLFNYITQMIYEPRNVDTDFKFSAKKIAEVLNITREPRSPLEGAFFIDNLNQQKLFTFSEKELHALISSTIRNMQRLLIGVESHFTKVITHKQVFVTFPLAMGMPFVYKYSEPIVFIFQGKANSKLRMDRVGSLNTEIQFTYARNLDGSVGFLDTVGEVYASSGIINKLQFNIPAKLNIKVKAGDLKLSFELPEQDANLVHLSAWPYTALQKMNSLSTVAEDPATKLIKRSAKVVSTDLNLGQSTGVGLFLQGYSYSSDFKGTSNVFDTDFLAKIRNLLYQKDVALTHFNLKYLAKETINKAVTLTTFFDTLYNRKQGGEMGPASIITDVTANSQDRREEMSKRVASGIDSAKVQLIDISAVFDGEKTVEYVLTTAVASSLVDNKVQGALFARGSDQINAVFKMIKPKFSPMNFEEALKNEIKVTYEADIKIENFLNVHVKGVGERSEQYTEMLSNDPVGKQCLQETSKDNFYQKGCYDMIIKAHAPDFFKATVSYEYVPYASVSSNAYNLYKILKAMYSWEEKKDFSKTVEEGKIEIVSQAFYYDNYINYEYATQYGAFGLNNVEGMGYYPYAMAFYAPLTSWERTRNWFTHYQNLPFCTVDSNKIRTFSDRSYDYSLTGSWHVVMVDESNNFGKWADLVILARRPSYKQEEVYISYKSETGKYVEVEIKPTTVEVKSNTNKASEGALTAYWDSVSDTPLLEYFTVAEGIQVFSINNGALRIMYDSQRLVIFTDGHRSTTRGICGQSTTQVSDDYMTPYGLVDLPEHYGAAFSIDDDFSDNKTVELKKEAKLKAYQPVTKYTMILRSDNEWSKADNESIKGL